MILIRGREEEVGTNLGPKRACKRERSEKGKSWVEKESEARSFSGVRAVAVGDN